MRLNLHLLVLSAAENKVNDRNILDEVIAEYKDMGI
jgi:hypothetical protein